MSLVRAYSIPVEAYRGDALESMHTVVAAFCGDLSADASSSRYEIDAQELPSIWIRSTAKPFQLLPLLLHPEGAALLDDPSDIAISVASHDGTPQHAERVRGILQRHSIQQQQMRCGEHRPYFLQRLPANAPENANLYDALHNNCSGNHAALLLWARLCGVEADSYLNPESASQAAIHKVIRAASGSEPRIGVDNCGAPCYQLPLTGAAQAYLALASRDQTARWGETAREDLAGLGPMDAIIDKMDQIGAAMATQPRWVSGEGTEATRLAERFAGTLVIKHGAEGVLCVADRQRQVALALKVLDGNARALFPALLQLMQEFGWWDGSSDRLFSELSRPILTGPPGHTVGELRVGSPQSGRSHSADAPTPAL